jgi:hypothetical protein
MASGEVAGIGALLKPNKYSILKFVDLHPGGAAALSGQVILPRRFVLAVFFLLLRMSQTARLRNAAARLAIGNSVCAVALDYIAWRDCCGFVCGGGIRRVRALTWLVRGAALYRSHVFRCTRMIDWWRWTAWWCVA